MAGEDTTFSADDKVNLVNPGGVLVSVPKAQLSGALAYGYRNPTPQEIDNATNREMYGHGVENELKAGALGAADTFTFGTVPAALAASGMVPAEEQAALAKYNPNARLVGQGVGLGGGIAAAALTGGASAEAGLAGAAAEEGVGQGVKIGLLDALNPVGAASKIGTLTEQAIGAVGKKAGNGVVSKILAGASPAMGSAVEAGLYGLGNSFSEYSLGDPQALGEHLASNVGMSMLFGAGAGAALSGGKALTSKIWSRKAEEAGLREAIMEGASKEIVASGTDALPMHAAPTSLEELQAQLKNASYQGIDAAELPAKRALVDAMEVVPDLQTPINNLQLESLSSPELRNWYKAIQEDQGELPSAIKGVESLQKLELTQKLPSELGKIAPLDSLTHDAVKGGESLVEGFSKHYLAEKNDLAPLYKRFDEAGESMVGDFKTRVTPMMENAFPGATKYISEEGGALKLAPYKASMPFSKNAYGAIKDLLDAANDKELTLGGIRNVRASMQDGLNWLSAPRDAAQISAMRKFLMDYMQEQVEKSGSDMAVREAFKRYAINEENRSTMERIFGGSISDKASFAKTIKPEDVLDKLMGNTVTVQAAKQILSAEDFNRALGNYIKQHIAKVTDEAKNGFSSNKFATFLKNKAPELEAAFADNPAVLKRIKAMTDIMRILPDSPSINPSGTAKTLKMLEVIHKAGSLLHESKSVAGAVGGALKHLSEWNEKQKIKSVVNEVLGGKSFPDAKAQIEKKALKFGFLKKVEDAYQANERKITGGASNIFDVTRRVAVPAAAAKIASDQHDKTMKTVSTIKDLNGNPEKFLHHLDNIVGDLYAAAPNTAATVQHTIIKAAQFLQSKLPQPPVQRAFTPKKPGYSKSEIGTFQRYLGAVEHPTEILTQIKRGNITAESVEAVKTIYPQLFSQMQSAVMDQLAKHQGRGTEIPYRTRLSLSLFLGQDLEESTTQASIAMSQQAMASLGAEKDQAQAGAASPGAAKSLNLSNSLLTASQSSAQRGQA